MTSGFRSIRGEAGEWRGSWGPCGSDWANGMLRGALALREVAHRHRWARRRCRRSDLGAKWAPGTCHGKIVFSLKPSMQRETINKREAIDDIDIW